MLSFNHTDSDSSGDRNRKADMVGNIAKTTIINVLPFKI